jgi:hypothetical protein
LDDPVLDSVIHASLKSNNDITISLARLQEARSVFDERKLDRYPVAPVDASYSYAREQVPSFYDKPATINTFRSGIRCGLVSHHRCARPNHRNRSLMPAGSGRNRMRPPNPKRSSYKNASAEVQTKALPCNVISCTDIGAGLYLATQVRLGPDDLLGEEKSGPFVFSSQTGPRTPSREEVAYDVYSRRFKRVRVLLHTLPPQDVQRNSARQHNLGEGTSLQRPILLRDTFTLHPCYLSASLKKLSCSV